MREITIKYLVSIIASILNLEKIDNINFAKFFTICKKIVTIHTFGNFTCYYYYQSKVSQYDEFKIKKKPSNLMKQIHYIY